MPIRVLGAGDIVKNRTDGFSVLMKCMFLGKKETKNINR